MHSEDLDISIGQAITWHGADGCIMSIDGDSIVIEVMGETILTDADELAEQNEDLIIG